MALTTLRIHGYVGTNDGSQDADFRGPKFIGHPEDEHRTLLEYDLDDSDPLVAEALLIFPRFNALMHAITGKAEGPLVAILGKELGIRAGVWDKIAPK